MRLSPLILVSNRMTFRCYRADPCKCCRWSRTMDILIFSRNPPAINGGVSRSQRGAVRLLLGCLFAQVDALPGAGWRPGKQGSGWSAERGYRHDPPAIRSGPLPACRGGAGLVSEPEDPDPRPTHVTETLMAAGAILPGAFVAPAATRMGWSADRAVTELYSLHYRPLVRLAALLVRDTPTAEEVVQDAFMAMHGGGQRLRDAENAPAHLPQAGGDRPPPVLPHRTVVDKN